MKITSRIAQCQDCEWEEEDYITADSKARYHSKKTGHEVHIETAHLVRIKGGYSLNTSNKTK